MKIRLTSIMMLLLFITGCKKDPNHIYAIDEAQSGIIWTGASPATENTGTFSVKGNNLKVKDGKFISGTFKVPINTLNVTNLPPDLKGQLTEHLFSPDFFNIAIHPMAVFNILRVESYKGTGKEGEIAGANTLITGHLTMLNVARPVQFAAKVDVASGKINAEAFFQIDRTQWGMNYAADPALGEHHIYPKVKLQVKFTANKT